MVTALAWIGVALGALVLFMTWVLCRAAAMGDAANEQWRDWDEWEKEVAVRDKEITPEQVEEFAAMPAPRDGRSLTEVPWRERRRWLARHRKARVTAEGRLEEIAAEPPTPIGRYTREALARAARSRDAGRRPR